MPKETTVLNAPRTAAARRNPPPSARRKQSLPIITAGRNAAEAALSVAAAFAAMFVVAATALVLLGASSVTSLGSASAAMVSLAAGGKLSLGSASSAAGGLLSIGMAGSLDAMPLGVTLAGTAALGLAFYLPLRRWRRLTPSLMTGRIAAAAATCFALLLMITNFGKGTARLPSSLTSKLSGGLSSVTFGVSGAVLGGLAWLLVVLLAGQLTARLAHVPHGVAKSWLRAMVGPALSASIRVVMVLVLIIGAFAVGTAIVLGGGNGPKVAGAVLLLLPNLLILALSAGAGVPWLLSAGPSSTAGGGLGGMLGMLGRLRGGNGGTGGQVHAVHHSISIFGSPLGVALWLITVLVLMACAMLATSRTPVPARRDGTPAESQWARARRHAILFGALWGAGLSALVLYSRISGAMQVSIMGTPITGFGAHADASIVVSSIAGLVVGGVAGGAGSLLMDTVYRRRARGFSRLKARLDITRLLPSGQGET
jgi:hypothetical protein